MTLQGVERVIVSRLSRWALRYHYWWVVLPSSTISRPSAHVVLVDDSDRILAYPRLGLTKDTDNASFTPGGGIKPGENATRPCLR